jgi:hypothetical protein
LLLAVQSCRACVAARVGAKIDHEITIAFLHSFEHNATQLLDVNDSRVLVFVRFNRLIPTNQFKFDSRNSVLYSPQMHDFEDNFLLSHFEENFSSLQVR